MTYCESEKKGDLDLQNHGLVFVSLKSIRLNDSQGKVFGMQDIRL